MLSARSTGLIMPWLIYTLSHSGKRYGIWQAIKLWVCRSGPTIDMVPTFKTGNALICLLLKDGQLGILRTEDAERLQVLPL